MIKMNNNEPSKSVIEKYENIVKQVEEKHEQQMKEIVERYEEQLKQLKNQIKNIKNRNKKDAYSVIE